MSVPPRIWVTCDILLFSMIEGKLRLLLVRRARPPFRGRWAVPGGFVEEDESLERAALRELREETGVRGVALEQFGVFGDPGRDPRGRTVSVGYYALIDAGRVKVRAGDDAGDARWHAVDALPSLAFDHKKVVEAALARLRRKPVWARLRSRKLR